MENEYIQNQIMSSWRTSWRNKDQEIIIELTKHRIDICKISKMKKKDKGNVRYKKYILFYSRKDKNQRTQEGVEILTKDLKIT